MRPVLLAALLCALSRPAAAAGGLDVDPAVALTISGVAAAGLAVSALALSVEARDVGADPEWLPVDEWTRGRWVPSAHGVSNATLISTLALPLVAHAAVDAPGQEDAMWVYAEALSTTLALNMVVKRLAQRPRPYAFGPDGAARRAAEGSDAFQSFYSGHAASTFAAAVSGALALTLRTDDATARGVAWSLGLGGAAATATLRVRAGRHFPSDVLVGALAGSAAGALFPLLHARGSPALTGTDVAAGAAGLAGGVALALVLPVDAPGALAVGPAGPEGGLVASLAGRW